VHASSLAHPWTRLYDTGTPGSLSPYPAKTLVDYVHDNAAKWPDAPAVVFKGTRLSNVDLVRLSDRFASALVEAGILRGDRVALLLPNCPQFLIAELGAWKAGATVLPLNPLYTGSELIEPLRSAGVKVVITLTPFYERLKAIQPETGVKLVIATSIKEYLPPVVRLLFTVLKEKQGGHRIALQAGDVWFQDCLGRSESRVPPPPGGRPGSLMSSGTAGTPKAVVGLHRCLVRLASS
jgi:long-chain acyl-CoA synthetase